MNLSQIILKHKILLTGGGTAGSVVPLLGVISELKNKADKYDFLWLGTKNGPEKDLVIKSDINFKSITNGKLRRYWSFKNFIDPLFIMIAFFQSFYIILKFRPHILISAGSFVSVPVVWAGAILRIPILIHQQDVRPGLANKLMAPFAKVITVTLEKSLIDYGKKAVLVGNSIRKELKNIKITKREAIQKIGLKDDRPILLVLGGGTGAMFLNKLVLRNIKELVKFCQIIHITGQGKSNKIFDQNNYRSFEFLDTFGIIKAFTAADGVISRCGMGVLTELAYFSMPSILIPLPDSHQEDNANYLKEKNAAIVLSQNDIDDYDLLKFAKEILSDTEIRDKLRVNISRAIKFDGSQKIVKIIETIIK